jgi:hypothetical protein
MIAVKGLYDGKSIEFLEPLPEAQAKRKFLVVITFLEEKKKRPIRHAAENEEATSEVQPLPVAFYRFPSAKQRRMDKLLDKGNAGNLTIKERHELDKLVDEFEESTLQKALALDVTRKTGSRHRAKNTRKIGLNGH